MQGDEGDDDEDDEENEGRERGRGREGRREDREGDEAAFPSRDEAKARLSWACRRQPEGGVWVTIAEGHVRSLSRLAQDHNIQSEL